MDFILRIVTLGLFFAWRLYWFITEQKADREKPKTKERPSFFDIKRITRNVVWAVGGLLSLQLLGLPIFVMDIGVKGQMLGFALVMVGLGVAIVARKQLDTNWANAYEYQIKRKQTLVTTGIYAYIRNPIYTGLVVAVIGGEIVAKSYLFIPFFLFFWGAYKQAKLEEKILAEHFGKEYLTYKKRTKLLIPFVF